MIAENGSACLGKASLLLLLSTTSLLCRRTFAFGETGPRMRFQFRDFRVKPVEMKKKAPLLAPADNEYQEVRERYENSPINFGGRYVIVSVSCGAGCETGWIVNAQTGSMYVLPSVYCLPEPPWSNFQKMEFRRDSILLVVTGKLNVDEQNEGSASTRRYYYRFDGAKLKLIVSEAIKVDE